jgi:thioredoxin 2
MTEALHIVCPHCDATNRVPRAKLAAGGRCGVCHRPLFEGRPVPLDANRFLRHLERSDVPLVVDFWAPWCGPCHAMAPAFEAAARRLEPNVRLIKVNVDEAPELAARFRVRSIPTVVLALHGRELDRVTGAVPEGELVRWASRPAPGA